MKPNQSSFTLVVNAGGESRRMGRDKASLPAPGRDQIMLWRVTSRLVTLAISRIVIVINALPPVLPPTYDAPLTVVPDAFAGTGTLGGIATGLGETSEWAVVVAVDMPLVNPSLFQPLCDLALERDQHDLERWDAVVPIVAGHAQTLHALYHRRCLPAIAARLAAGDLRVANFLADVRVRWVTEAELTPFDADLVGFTNINTPQEWQLVQRQLATDSIGSSD